MNIVDAAADGLPKSHNVGKHTDYHNGGDNTIVAVARGGTGARATFEHVEGVQVHGAAVPQAITSFDDSRIPVEIRDAAARRGYQRPMPVQCQAWPALLEGKDLIGLAETGSGKTAAFVVPILIQCEARWQASHGPGTAGKQLPQDGEGTSARRALEVLIIAPTRELVDQIDAEIFAFSQQLHVRHTCVYGGVPKAAQIRDLKACATPRAQDVRMTCSQLTVQARCNPFACAATQPANQRMLQLLMSPAAHVAAGTALPFKSFMVRAMESAVHVLVATPGRLLDLLAARATHIDGIHTLVLDEADHLLSLGFEAQLRRIVKLAPPCARRQTTLWSATWSQDVQRVSRDFLRADAIKIAVAGAGDKLVDSVAQRFQLVTEGDKWHAFAHLLESEWDGGRVLCFARTQMRVDALVTALRQNGWPALGMHGRKAQLERLWVLEEFREGNSPILVATDVAARGLDVKDVQVVINYDVPKDVHWYIQRVGRTGRAGRLGLAISFLTEPELAFARALEALLEQSGQGVPAELAALLDNDETS